MRAVKRKTSFVRFACRAIVEDLERRTLLAVGVLDQVIFGNSSSESAHSFSSTSTQVIAGNLGQTARQELPLSTVQINGGSMTFNLAVDPVKRNYFTVKLWGGDDTNQMIGRLYLYIPVGGVDYEVGYRHEGDYAPLSVAADTPSNPGEFIYSTTLLPLAMTQGKTSIALKIQSTGELYGLGSGGPPSGNYQFNMTLNSRGIYRAYTSTSAMLDVSDETQGIPPTPTIRPSPTEASVLGASGTYTVGLDGWVNGRLSAAITAFTATDVEMLARSYSVSQLTASYQNPAVVNKVIDVLDGFATDYYTNPTTSVTGTDGYGADGGNEVWGGRFGALGWAIHLLSSSVQFQSSLDAMVNYGTAGGTKTRRQAWGDMLLASRDNGRFNRDSRYLTNQTLIADSSIYQANRGLEDLGNANAFSETAAQRYLKEAIGLQPWLGSDLAGGGSSMKYGANYYQVTPDGLTREWGYPGGYGEMQTYAATFYQWTGNTAFRDQAIKIEKARAPFRRPAIETVGANQYQTMEREGVLAWRGVREADGYITNDINYGDPGGFSEGMRVAGVTLDPTAVGYAKQMLADNQYFSQLIADPRYYSTLTFDSRFAFEVYDDYNAVKNAPDSGIRLPMTAGQPDFAFADEEDGIVAIKHGSDRLWIESYWQAKDGTGINGIGRFDYVTANYEQYGDIETSPQFDFSGSYYVRPNLIDKPEPDVTQFNPPSPPTQAYAGEILPIGNELGAHDDQPFRGKADYWAFRFGNYLIGINEGADQSYELKLPIGTTSAPDLLSGATKSGPVMVAPGSTVALYLSSNVDTAPVPNAPLSLLASDTAAQVSLKWSAGSGATGYNVKRADTSGGPYTTIAPNISGTTFTDTNVTKGKTYYYVVSGVNANGEGYNSGETTASAGLPGAWANQDIGTVALPGTATAMPGGFRLTASGGSFGTSDSFQFASIPVTGDVTIIAHVAGMMDTLGGERGGVMIRESLAANSAFAAVFLEDGGNVRLTRRASTGAAAGTAGGGPASTWAPRWIKLVRSGNSFSAFTSTDGVNWGSAFTTQTVTFTASTIYVGLALTSQNSNQTTVANYDNVQILPGVTVTGASYPIDQSPNTLTFTFNTDVSATLTASDLQLSRSDGGAVPGVQSVGWNGGTKTATFTLTAGLPANGNYTATLPAYSVNSTTGQPLNADFAFQYTFLLGDATKNGVVDIADFNVLAAHYGMTGQTWSTGDFNYDHVVNLLDLNALASNFGKTPSSASAIVAQSMAQQTSLPAASGPGNLFSTSAIGADNKPTEFLNQSLGLLEE